MAMPGLGKAQLQVVLDTISDAVFLVDRTFRIVAFNRVAEDLTGHKRGEVVGERCRDVLRTPACGNDCCMSRAVRSGEAQLGENTLQTRDDRSLAVTLRVAALRDGDGKIVGGIEAFRIAAAPSPKGPRAAGRKTAPLSILAASERATIEAVLLRNGGNQVAASRELGISRTTLWRKMRKLGIDTAGDRAIHGGARQGGV